MSSDDEELRRALRRSRDATTVDVLPSAGEIRQVADRRTRNARLRTATVGMGALVGLTAITVVGGPELLGILPTQTAPTEISPTDIPPTGADSPVVTYLRRDPQGMAGLSAEGVLEMRRGCLYVGNALVVWPDDAVWNEADQTVEYVNDSGRAVIAVGGHFPTGTGAVRQSFEELADSLSDDAKSQVRACTAAAPGSQTELLAISYP